MGYIKEPKGIDLVVAPSVLTEEDRKRISEIIAIYKRTGKKPPKTKSTNPRVRAAKKVQRRKAVA